MEVEEEEAEAEENVEAVKEDTVVVEEETEVITVGNVEAVEEALEAVDPPLLTTEVDPGAIIDHALDPTLHVSLLCRRHRGFGCLFPAHRKKRQKFHKSPNRATRFGYLQP